MKISGNADWVTTGERVELSAKFEIQPDTALDHERLAEIGGLSDSGEVLKSIGAEMRDNLRVGIVLGEPGGPADAEATGQLEPEHDDPNALVESSGPGELVPDTSPWQQLEEVIAKGERVSLDIGARGKVTWFAKGGRTGRADTLAEAVEQLHAAIVPRPEPPKPEPSIGGEGDPNAQIPDPNESGEAEPGPDNAPPTAA